MMEWILLLVSLVIILLGATVFTNGLEWFGKKLNLSDGAIGSIFAAVGTALPETLVPIVAILFGSAKSGHEIGVGAIIGAPFMLGTLAFFITGLAVILNRKKRADYPILRVDTTVMQRDMEYFILLYGLAIAASFLGSHPVIRLFIALSLVFFYFAYVFKTLKSSSKTKTTEVSEPDISACYFAPKTDNPPLWIIGTQVIGSLFLIVSGSYVFVDKVQFISSQLGVSPFILAMIIAPIATELPEKFNSVIWINKGKDTLAVGNITGAMIFQGSVITAIGITMTEWKLDFTALVTVALTFTSVGIAYLQIRIKNHLTSGVLLLGGLSYLLFIFFIALGGV